jgi:hypothetical protein
MSWDQGVQPREDISPDALAHLERKYELAYGESALLEYLTWFGPNPREIIAHFDSNRALRFHVRAEKRDAA